MPARAGVLSLLCHACAGGHLPPPPSPSKLDPRVQGNDSLFWRGVNAPIKAVLFFLDPRLRKDDRRRGVAGGGFFHRW